MRRILLSILLSLLASSSFAGGPGLLFTAGGSPPTTPVITATPGNTTNTITLTSGDVGALTNVLYWDTTSRATYDLYANSISNATLVAASFPGTPYVHTGRTNGVPYYYMLRGTDVAGSTSSAEASGTPTAGSTPTFESVAIADPTGVSSTIITDTSLTVSTGSLIVVAVAGSDNAVTGITCGASNALALVKTTAGSGSYWFTLWYKENAVSYTGTCTATFAGNSDYRSIKAASYAGIATSGSLDKSSCSVAACDTKATASTSITAQNVTTATNSQLLVGVFHGWDISSNTVTGANSYTRRTASPGPGGILDKVVASTGTYPSGAFATVGTSDSYMSLFATFKGL